MSVIDMFKKKIEGQIEIYGELDYYYLDKYIEDTFGKFETVLHEVESKDIHVDIYVIKPTKKNNYYTLVTCGMGAHKMLIPDDLDVHENELAYSELVMYVPKNWNFKDLENPDYVWPLNLMRCLAKIPIENYTWLGAGHTVGNASTYSSKTKLNNSLLLITKDDDDKYITTKLPSGKKLNFYTVMPLYEEEYDFIVKNGLNKLFNKFDKANIDYPPIVDIKRINTCKKK